MNKYEKAVGFKTIYLTFVRRFIWIICVFVPVVFGVFLFVMIGIKKTYSSSISFSKVSSIGENEYVNVQQFVNDHKNNIVASLAEQGAKHSNGSAITLADLNFVFQSYSQNKTSFNISLSSLDRKIVQPAMQTLRDYTAANYGNAESFTFSDASKAVGSKQRIKYFLIGAAAGAVLALGIAFVEEILEDQVYDASDITLYGLDATEILLSK